MNFLHKFKNFLCYNYIVLKLNVNLAKFKCHFKQKF